MVHDLQTAVVKKKKTQPLDVFKTCLALWPRSDFEILRVKIRVLEFPKTTFFGRIISFTAVLFLHLFSELASLLCTDVLAVHLACMVPVSCAT